MLRSIHPGYEYDSKEISDQDLWKAFTGGNRTAFEVLFKRYYEDLYTYAVKFSGKPEMAEDHIQKLFVKLWQKRKNLEEVEGVKTYLWTALRRGMIDTFRKIKTREKYRERLRQDHFRMELSAEEFIIGKEINAIRRRELKAAIDQLSPQKKEALYLKFYEGMSYEEIGEIMSINYQTSRNYIYHALKTLKSHLHTRNLKAVSPGF